MAGVVELSGQRVMERRTFIVVIAGGLLAAPLAAEGQQSGKVFRIGILGNVPLTDPEGARVWGAFIEGLRELGYVEGKNITIEHRSTEGHYERLPELAAELVRLKVDVIITPGTQNVLAAEQATRTIPIVMAFIGDPVGSGVVASIGRPGGNVTGLSAVGPEIVGKQLELLKEIAPKVSRVAILWNPANQGHALLLKEAEAVARPLKIQVQALEVRGSDGFTAAFGTVTRERIGAILVPADGMFILNRARIADLAARARLPAMYGLREYVEAGGLVVYGPSMRESFRHAATYVGKILKGAKPGDLPVEQPTKFELVINMKTAKVLGLTIPQSLLLRADQVIE